MSVFSWKCRVKSEGLVAPRFIGVAPDLEQGQEVVPAKRQFTMTSPDLSREIFSCLPLCPQRRATEIERTCS